MQDHDNGHDQGHDVHKGGRALEDNGIRQFNVPRITVCFDTVGASESRTAADD
jgi:hypothetical protein